MSSTCGMMLGWDNAWAGACQSPEECINNSTKWGKLWLHESERVYLGRLVTLTDNKAAVPTLHELDAYRR